MAEPARKPTPDIEPDIKPSFGSVRGGGESTPDRANLRALNNQESSANPQTSDNESLEQREKNPSNVIKGPWADNTTYGGNAGSQKSGGRFNFIKKKGPLTAIIMSLLVGGGGVGFFLTSTLAPIAFFEAIADDLNDQLGALDIRSDHMAHNKLIQSEKSQAIKGCSKLSIRCKFATLSDKQIAKLKRAGIEVVPSTETSKGILGGRTIPKSYIFQGKEYSPDKWSEMLNTNRQAQTAQRKANNMKYAGLSDKSFITRVLGRFGVSLKPPELKGTAQERMNALMNRAKVTNAADVHFSPTGDTDKDGNPTYKLDGDTDLNEDGTPKRTYTQTEKTSMDNAQTRVVNAKPPSKVTKASVGALSVLGYWDLACSIKNMIGAASITAKIANQQELIQYAMPIASKVGQMKAGDISPEDAEAIGKFFTSTDSRKYIPDITVAAESELAGKLQPDVSTPTEGDSNNPNYGKSGMNSGLYIMSSTGKVAPASTSRSTFSLGMGQNQLLAGFSDFAKIASALVNVGPVGACSFIQSGIVRGVGIIASVALGAASVGAGTVIQVGISASLMVAMGILDGILNGLVSGDNISTDNLADAPVDRADALWTGMGAIYGAAAQPRGLIPGNSEQIMAYQNGAQSQAKQGYIALESSEANPLDVYSQYSFLGSFARSILGYTSSSVSGSSALSNIASIVSGGMASIFKSSVFAAATDQSRFKQCDDEAYKEMGIDPDVQCNVRYYMPAADLAMDTDEVAAYMEGNGENGYVDPVTGLPPGYTPPQPKESQGAAMDFLNGVVSQYADTRNYVNDYGKYLDYCAYRTMPWGETYEEDPTGTMRDWQTGKKCMTQGAPYSYFRIYTLDKTLQEAEDDEAIDNNSNQAPPTARPENSVDRGRGWTIKNDTDYSSYACDVRTKDVGTYTNPRLGFTLRLCQITSFPGIPGTNIDGDANVVSSLISTNLINMFEAAKSDGIPLGVSSGMRSVKNVNYTDYSQHGRGLAVDIGSPKGGSTICFGGGGPSISNANACRDRPDSDVGGKAVRWLDANAEKYGFYNLRSEPWHWSAGEL